MPETADKLAQYKARARYSQPPEIMDPPAGALLGRDAEWHDLVAWFDEHTDSWHDSLLVYLAERYGQTISEAYADTDGYAKSRLGIRGHN